MKVFAGSVNHELVAALVAAGNPAVGISGLDAGLTLADQLSEELGAVGRPTATDARLLNHLCAGGYLPVVACVAGDGKGRVFNVNADQMAVSCAIGFEAGALIFLTDVEGVRGAAGTTLAHLAASECDRLIRDGHATGGMQAKLEASKAALMGGVRRVLIGPGAQPGVLRRLLEDEALGTRITLDAARGGRSDE